MKRKKKLKEANGALDTDSLWNRNSSIKKDYDGESAQEKLGIEPDMATNIDKASPMKMMDIVLQSWAGDSIRGDQEAYEDDLEGDEGDTGQDLSGDFDFAKDDDEEIYDSNEEATNEEEDDRWLDDEEEEDDES